MGRAKKPRNHPAKEARKTAAIYASEQREMRKAFGHMFDANKPPKK